MTSPVQMPAPMSGEEVRRRFVEFFTERGHREVPSSSLVPHNDPTVLLTTAGMQQMTPYFLGLEQPPAQRMVSVQKCFRTVDIDEVGDESHCTFFFMLGNFSVGDYFKRESLRLVLGVPHPRPGHPRRPPLPDRPPRRRGRAAHLARRDRHRRRAHRPARRQLVGSGRADRAEWAGLRDLFRPRPGARLRRRRIARPGAIASATWRSGTTSSWSSSSTRTARARRCRASTSTPAWGWSGWRWSCRGPSRSTTSTSTRRSSSTWRELAGVTYGARRRRPTGRCASSPTTRGAGRS